MTKRNKVTAWILGAGVLLFAIHCIRTLLVSVPAALVKVEQPGSFRSSTYEALLKKFVRNNCVDYQGLCGSSELNEAVDELKRISPANMNDDEERLAFWINACNLLVLRSVCDKYPITSVKELGNSFNAKEFIVGGKTYTVQDIYALRVCPLCNRINPNAVFLVCQAAMGNPPLPDHVIEKPTLDDDAEKAARRFVNDPKNVYYDGAAKSINISPYFGWIKVVFSGRFENPYSFIDQYLDRQIVVNQHLRSMTLPFDWTLNDRQFTAK